MAPVAAAVSDDELIDIAYDPEDFGIDDSHRIMAGNAYDEQLEAIHASLSKRETIRTSMASTRSSASSTNTRTSRHRRTGSNSEVIDKEPTKSGHSRRPPTASWRSSNETLNDFSSSSIGSSAKEDNEKNNVSQRRRRYSRGRVKPPDGSSARQGASRESSSDGRRARSPGAIEKLLEYKVDVEYSPTNERSNPLHRGLTRSRDSSAGNRIRSRSRASGHRQRSSDTARLGRRREASTDNPRSPRRGVSTDDPRGRRRGVSTDDPRGRQRSSSHRPSRRSASQQHGINPLNKRRNDERRNSGEDRYGKNSQSLHSMRTLQRRFDQQPIPQQIGDDGIQRGDTDDTFERVWANKQRGGESSSGDLLKHSSLSSLDYDNEVSYHTAYRTISGPLDNSVNSRIPMDSSVASRTLDSTTNSNTKKTKLEKIHELQAKIDRYKKDIRKMADSRSRYRHDLEDSKEEVVSLQKMLEDRDLESTTLRIKVAELQEALDDTKAKQRKELTELSDTAKDLARVNIDYAKSVDEARSVKAEMDRLKDTVADREKQISSLEDKLKESVGSAKHLEADILYADEQIDKLEAEIKSLEQEVGVYRKAAEKDASSGGANVTATDNMREAKYEAEKRKLEDREKQLEEQNKRMEDQKKAFEAERHRYLEEQKERERDLEEKQRQLEERTQELDAQHAREQETFQISEQDNQRREQEHNKILKTLEDENAALKGRLKSEQLDSTRKLQNKDDAIAQLQEQVARLTAEREESDSAHDSPASMLQEIEALREDVSKTTAELEGARMQTLELQNEVNDLQISNREMIGLVSTLEAEVLEQKKEVENQKRKTLEWQKKSGEWSDKAHLWKEKSEQWEKRAKDSSNSESCDEDDGAVATTQDPQALFLAAAIEKSSNAATGTWRFGQRIFGKQAESEDELQALVGRLEAENATKDTEIKTLKSEMVKLQTNFKEQAYSKVQEYEKLQREKDEIEQDNANLYSELELARKLNQTISGSGSYT